jgi:hypothetical protein
MRLLCGIASPLVLSDWYFWLRLKNALLQEIDERAILSCDYGSAFRGVAVMISKLADVGASKAVMGGSLALLLCGLGTTARADAIPYPAPGGRA